MKYALLISGIVELIGGLLVYFHPALAFNVTLSNSTIFKMYGLLAAVIGLINLMAFKHYSESRIISIIFLSMMFFHAAVAFLIYADGQEFFHQQQIATLLHLVIFCIFLGSYLNDLKPDRN